MSLKIMRLRACGVHFLIGMFVLCLLPGCGAAMQEDLRISAFMQKKQHHEIIKALQSKVDRRERITSFQLLLLAGSYYEIRDYEKARVAVDLMEKQLPADSSYYSGDLTPYPDIFKAYLFLDQGDYANALKSAEKAHAIVNRPAAAGNAFHASQMIDIAGIAGVACAIQGKERDAGHYLNLLQNVNIENTILGPEKQTAIARIFMAAKRYPEALAAISNPEAEVSGSITAFYDQTFQKIPRFFILAKSLYETGRIQEAKQGYDQLLKHPQIRQIGGIFWPVLLDRAKIAALENRNPAAIALLKEAAEVIEAQRATIHTESGRIGYVGDKQAVYQELIALLVGSGQIEQAFEYAERAKGRALVDLLSLQTVIDLQLAENTQSETTFKQLAESEQSLNVISDPGAPALPDQRGVAVRLKNDLAVEAPEFASLVTVAQVPLAQIQQTLAGDETLLEYYASAAQWYAFVVTRRSTAVRKLTAADIEETVRDFRQALTHPNSDRYIPLAQSLYAKLFAPVSGLISTPNITIVPHGVLHYLPFSALRADKEDLINHHAIRILPSASVLKYLAQRKKRADAAALVMGNPDLGDPKYDLAFAEEEAHAVAGTLPNATVLVRGKATAAFMIENGGRYNLIHIAAHGLFDPDNPLRSALLLAKEKERQGALTAKALYRMRLNADLVTLSACETALGKVSRGDDVIGFTRGFFYAGARAVISSLWMVDDRATRDLMIAFYQNLSKMAKDEALRQAQLNTRKNYPHPYYWAAFQLVGLRD